MTGSELMAAVHRIGRERHAPGFVYSRKLASGGKVCKSDLRPFPVAYGDRHPHRKGSCKLDFH